MRYADGKDILPGDEVVIDSIYKGRVVAPMDFDMYLPGEESWSYISCGIMVQTEFAGYVHYTDIKSDALTLIRRGLVA